MNAMLFDYVACKVLERLLIKEWQCRRHQKIQFTVTTVITITSINIIIITTTTTTTIIISLPSQTPASESSPGWPSLGAVVRSQVWCCWPASQPPTVSTRDFASSRFPAPTSSEALMEELTLFEMLNNFYRQADKIKRGGSPNVGNISDRLVFLGDLCIGRLFAHGSKK